MTIADIIQKVTILAKGKGWSVNISEQTSVNARFEFQYYTRHGQDFNFSAELKNPDADTLIADIEQYYEAFDPDYEAYLWIGEDGHGKCGAPYHIKDIVSDMEEAEEKIYDLLQACQMEFL